MAGGASSSFTSHVWTYEVFLSFRGEDTRMGFTGNLYNVLDQRGIRTFIDKEELKKGEELTPALNKAIKESRIAIIVLSKNYAFSSFCLNELTTILDCLKGNDRLVLPIFYEVDPYEVRHQKGSYGEALIKHEERPTDKEKLDKWRTALNRAANLSGFHFKQGDEYEYEFIRSVVKVVSSKINRAPLRVADYPVGLESRMLKVKSLLKVGSDDVVHMVGIHGIGGIGKTTVALAAFNSLAIHFEGACFLEDVRENSAKYGLVHLQEKLLSEIVGDRDINLGNVNNGKSIIKQRLHRKKVLLVLDDIDKIEQLRAFAGAPDWFGFGSRVIITTRDKGLLTTHEVEETEVEELNDTEARELLCWNAFKTGKVDPNYTKVFNRAVTYASRLPLALEIIGSNLYVKKGIEEWEIALDRYEKIPDNKIQEILKVSFDSLEEEEKKIFLDIACCFGGLKLGEVENILRAHHGLSIRSSIALLIEKSLLKINDGFVTLHELIQHMGREIVRLESQEPGERSRLWFYEDVVQVLEENTGTDKIQILILDFPKDEEHSNERIGEEVDWDGEAFKKMKKLKTLIIRNGSFTKGPTNLPDSLRVLRWCTYPSTSFPNDFHPKRLAVLELPESNLTPGKPFQRLVYLKVLDLDYNECITQIPDVSGIPKLEKLSFKHCENLSNIDDSVGFLDKLRILDASRCNKLKTFPPIILTSLEQLNLSHCSMLESFPEILGKMEKITELHIMGSPIKELPPSIQNLTQLRKLELQMCRMVQLPSSIVLLQELCLMSVSKCEGLSLSKQDKGEEMVSKSSNTESLTLSDCNISDEFLPMSLTWFANVKDLNLSGNNFIILDACIKECHFLRNLKLDECRLLKGISGIPWKLETFSAKGCTSLKELLLLVFPARVVECLSLKELILDDCVYLGEIRGDLPNLDHFSAKSCTSLTSSCTSMFLNQKSVEAGNKMFSLPGTKIPDWFTYRTRGESISFWFRGKFPEISLGLVIGLVNEKSIKVKFSPRVFINNNKQSIANRTVYEFGIATDHIFLFDLRLLKFEDSADVVFSENDWNHVEVSYADHITNDEVQIKQVAKHSGIHVIGQTGSMQDIRFTKPYHQKRKTDDYLLTWESESHQSSEEKHKSVEIKVSGTQLMTTNVESLPAQAMQNVNQDPNSMEGRRQRVKTKAKISWKSQTVVASEAEGQASGPTTSVEKLPEDEVHPTTAIQNEPPANEEGGSGDDIEVEAVSFGKPEYQESSSNSKGSDSDDPFDRVNTKLKFSPSGKQTTSSGDASLPIRKAIDDFELLLVKDLSEVSSNPTLQSRLDHLLNILSTSSHPKVTVEVKEALVDFKRKAFASFEEFQATVEPVNKLKNFENEWTRIKHETDAGKDRRKDIRNSIKKASLVIKEENSRKKELESEIETLRNQLATKESNLEQLVLNVKNQEATISTYSITCDSLDDQARALLKEADDLVAANTGVEEEVEAAEIKQNRIKSTWSTDLTTQFIKIKKKILGRYE